MKSHCVDTVGRGLRQACEWTLVALAAVALLVAVVVPKLAGATPYTVLTGSMRPAMPPGTLVVVRRVDPSSIAVGDVITYQVRSDDPEVVTHRVVAQGFDAAGRATYRTQGDANPVPDPALVHDYQLVGRRWYAVPYLGYASRLLTGRERQVGLYVVAGGLIVYALVMFAGEWRDRRRAHRPRPGRHVHA